MKVELTINNTVLTVTMQDSQTTQDFMALLPLTLTLEDYAGIEKVSDLPERLSIEGVPSGSKPTIGDITYYAPWGNLAIFYEDFRYADGLVILGNIEDDIDILKKSEPFEVTIDLAK